jgi:hypothetical protein
MQQSDPMNIGGSYRRSGKSLPSEPLRFSFATCVTQTYLCVHPYRVSLATFSGLVKTTDSSDMAYLLLFRTHQGRTGGWKRIATYRIFLKIISK